jgi:hypothetical protein
MTTLSLRHNVETLKADGKHFEAGQLSKANGDPIAHYGCHYGLIKTRDAAVAQFYAGFNHVAPAPAAKKAKKAKKVATFSNGLVDVYKGKRDVKAAWMVILPNGKIISGHSYDRDTAQKTAEGNAMTGAPHLLKMSGTRGRDIVTPAAAAYFAKIAKDHGFADRKAYNADAEIRRAAWRAACKIEIVDL